MGRSNKKFVISDTHFGHKNMATMRGFKSVEEHDEHIVKMWNSVVQKKDTVYLLGDVTMEKKSPYKILSRLNGIINVVLGNHDRRQDVPELLKYVNSVCSFAMVNGKVLTHIPIHESQLGRFKVNVHGHLHDDFIWKIPKISPFIGKGIKDKRYLNVSAEVINYTPVEL